MMNLPIILPIFTIIFMQQQILAQINDIEQNQQKLEFLSKLNFKLSSNFYFTKEEKKFTGEYFINSNANRFENYSPKLQPHVAIEHPNIDIKFYLDEVGNIRCDYVLWGLTKNAKTMPECSQHICVKRWNLEDGWRMELPVLPHLYLPPAVANSNPATNVADLKTALNALSENDILRTCSSAYFYRGFSKSNEEARRGRIDWILYLLEGKLECNLAGKSAEENRKLLARGFEIKFFQINLQWTPNGEKQCGLHSTMSQFYDENNEEGNFLIGGIIGSAQLDKIDDIREFEGGKIEKPFDEKIFWAWRPEKKEKEELSDKNKEWDFNAKWANCEINYGKWLTDDEGKYMVKIEVAHWCSENDMSQHRPITSWIFEVDPNDKFVRQSEGIFDWKDRLNDVNAHAILDLTSQDMTMPDENKLKGILGWKKIDKTTAAAKW